MSTELEKLIINEFKNINNKLDNLDSNVLGLKEDVKVLKTDVSGLKEDVKVLKTEVSGLKEDVEVLKTEVSGLKEDVEVLKTDVLGLKKYTATLNKKINDVKSDTSMLNKEVFNVIKPTLKSIEQKVDIMTNINTARILNQQNKNHKVTIKKLQDYEAKNELEHSRLNYEICKLKANA